MHKVPLTSFWEGSPKSFADRIFHSLKKNKTIDTGLPSELLRHRADIRQAEWELLASHTDVKAAKAAFFPSLRLLGHSGIASFDWAKMFLLPESSIYQLASGLTAPIFQHNQLRASYETANANQKTALVNYQQTVLNSYYEVFTTLNAYHNLQEQIQLKQQEVEVQKRFYDELQKPLFCGL